MSLVSVHTHSIHISNLEWDCKHFLSIKLRRTSVQYLVFPSINIFLVYFNFSHGGAHIVQISGTKF